MQNVQRSLKKTGKQMQRVGSSLTVGLTAPLLGIGALAIKAAADMETLKTSLDTVFQGDSNASNQAFEEIKEFAATTPFQLDQVATAFIKLKNLGLDPSIDALTSYGNTASALGKSLDQMIEAVADASVGEFERLKEFGIKAKSQGDQVSFTFQGVTTTVQKNAAQISDYLKGIGNVNFAGSIARQADTFKGRLSTLKDNIAQSFASIGDIIITYITPLFNKLNGIIKQFQDLSPSTKKWIVILGGVAAAIGPLLALAGTILPAILTGFAILTGPIGLVAAALTAIGVIIYKNWQPIKKTLVDIGNYFVDLYNESTLFRIAIESVVTTFKTLWEVGKFVFEGLKSIVSGFIGVFTNGFTTVGKIIKAVLTGDIAALPGIIKDAATEGSNNFSALTDNLGSDWDNLMTGITKVTNEGLANITSRKKLKYLGENVDASAITDEVSKATAAGLTTTLPTVSSGGTGAGTSANLDALDFENSFDLSGLDAMLEDADIGRRLQEKIEAVSFAETFNRITGETEDFVVASDEQIARWEAHMNRMAELGAYIGDAVGGAFSDLAGGLVDSLGLAANGFEGFVKGLVSVVTKLIAIMLSSAIAQSIPGAVASGTATGPLAIFTTPAFIATAVGGVLAAFAAIPKFATGGIVGGSSFYGDKLLARVNSGEAIFNEDQQKKLYNLTNPAAQAVNVSLGGGFEIEGSKLRLVLDRSDKSTGRYS